LQYIRAGAQIVAKERNLLKNACLLSKMSYNKIEHAFYFGECHQTC
jgi:hypothetical protein